MVRRPVPADLTVKEQAMGRSTKRRSRKRWVAGVVGAFVAMVAIGATQDTPPTPPTTSTQPMRTVMAPSNTSTATPTRTARKVRPPKPTIAKPKVSAASLAAPTCDGNYTGACLDPSASDYDCDGGSGNGPLYTGRVTVVGSDHFRLDGDGDGLGCE
jgi:hypothetical protein